MNVKNKIGTITTAAVALMVVLSMLAMPVIATGLPDGWTTSTSGNSAWAVVDNGDGTYALELDAGDTIDDYVMVHTDVTVDDIPNDVVTVDMSAAADGETNSMRYKFMLVPLGDDTPLLLHVDDNGAQHFWEGNADGESTAPASGDTMANWEAISADSDWTLEIQQDNLEFVFTPILDDGTRLDPVTIADDYPTGYTLSVGTATTDDTGEGSRSVQYNSFALNGNVVEDFEPAPNTAPVADAGPDQTVEVNETVQFNGSNSSDADGDTLTYSWDLNEDGTEDATGASPTYVYDTAGTYNVTLTVSDGIDSDTDMMTVTVEESTGDGTDDGTDADDGDDAVGGGAGDSIDRDTIIFAGAIVTLLAAFIAVAARVSK